MGIPNGRDHDHLFILLICGDTKVGKSQLLQRFAEDSFSDQHITTIGLDYRTHTIDIDRRIVKLIMKIWDTEGQERYRISPSPAGLYHDVHGFIMMYDVTNY